MTIKYIKIGEKNDTKHKVGTVIEDDDGKKWQLIKNGKIKKKWIPYTTSFQHLKTKNPL